MPALNMRPVESGHRPRTELDKIPADIRDTLEEALADAPGMRLEVGPFALNDKGEPVVITGNDDAKGTKEAAEEWLVHARSYAYFRDPRATFAGNPTQAGLVRFTISPR